MVVDVGAQNQCLGSQVSLGIIGDDNANQREPGDAGPHTDHASAVVETETFFNIFCAVGLLGCC